MYIYFIVVFICLFVIFLYFSRVSRKSLMRKSLTIYEWMKIGKDSRTDLDYNYKIKVLERKTRLINKTRSEYLNLYKK